MLNDIKINTVPSRQRHVETFLQLRLQRLIPLHQTAKYKRGKKKERQRKKKTVVLMTHPQIQYKQNYSTNAVPSHMEIMTLKTEKPSQKSSGCQARVQQLKLSGKLSLSWCFNLPCSEERKREKGGAFQTW